MDLKKDINRLKAAKLELEIVTRELAEKWRINKVNNSVLSSVETPERETCSNRVLQVLEEGMQ